MNKSGLRICIIGAGKVAWSVIPALLEKKYRIEYIISKNIDDAAAAAKKFGIKEYSSSWKDLPEACNTFFLLIPDDQLEKTASGIAGLQRNLKNKFFIHFSGVLSSEILGSIHSKGAATASLHIMQTFPSKRRVKLAGAFASVESKNKSLEQLLIRITDDLGMNAFKIKADKKIEYHLSGVYASNFITSNLYNAEKFFKNTGSTAEFNKFIKSILNTTVKNVLQNGAVNSLSGPVERGDLETIRLHTELLSAKNSLLLMNYIVQSLNILNIKKEQVKLTPAHKKIEEYLKKELLKAI
jgi:predicted short-subunit dehydrogenase-like oxidoreductase (DUF2520 family)